MRAVPTAAHWVGTAIATTVVSTLLAYPFALPEPLRGGVETSVNAAARAFLYLWDEPADLLDMPLEPEAAWDPQPPIPAVDDTRVNPDRWLLEGFPLPEAPDSGVPMHVRHAPSPGGYPIESVALAGM